MDAGCPCMAGSCNALLCKRIQLCKRCDRLLKTLEATNAGLGL